MRPGTIKIEIYNKREDTTTAITVRKLADNLFKMEDYPGFNFRVTAGNVFKARLNKDGKYEITTVLREEDYIQRKFFLVSFHQEEEYKPVSDEIIKQGGYLEVQMGHVAVINLPKDSQFDPTDVLRLHNLDATEVYD